jgi:hypothetical protein
VAAALAGVGVPVHEYPPASAQPPAVAIIPGEPYLEGLALHRDTATVRLIAQCITADTAPRAMDDLIWAVHKALTDAGWPPDAPVPPPRHDSSTGTLITRIPVTLHWKD